MAYYGYDNNSFDDNTILCKTLHSKQRVARKDHPCSFCNKPIKAGTKYIHAAQIYDGDFQFIKYHHRYCGEED